MSASHPIVPAGATSRLSALPLGHRICRTPALLRLGLSVAFVLGILLALLDSSP